MAQYVWWVSEVSANDSLQGVMYVFKGFGAPDGSQLRTELREALRETHTPIDAFVVLSCEYELDEMRQMFRSSKRIDDFDLLGERPIYLVALDSKMIPRSVESVRGDGKKTCPDWCTDHAVFDQAWLDAMSQIVKRGAVVLQAPAGYHFLKGSDRRSSHFIRAENASLNGPESSFMALSVMREIDFRNVVRLHIDSVTILAIALSISTHLILFKTIERPPRIESFHSWDGIDSLSGLSANGADIVLISASSSSGLAAAVCKKTGLPAKYLTTVFSFAQAGPLVLFSIDTPPNFVELKTADLGDSSITPTNPMRVVGEHFLFEHKKPRLVRITLQHKSSSEQLAFLSAFQCCDLVRAHQRVQSAAKMRRLSLAPEAFHNETVKQSLETWIDQVIVLADVSESRATIVRVGGKNSVQLAALLSGRLNDAAVPIVKTLSIDDVQTELQLDAEQPIFVVSDVIGSGHRLVALSAELRQIQPKAKIIYLVALHLAPSSHDAETLKSALERSWKPRMYQFHPWWQSFIGDDLSPTVERAIRELDLLEIEPEAIPRDPTVPFLRDASAHNLTENGVFLPDSYDVGTFNRGLLHLIFCSTLQRARDAKDLPLDQTLRSSEFEQVLIDADTFTRFSDNSMRASLLWAARPSEIDYQSDERSSALMASTLMRWVKSSRACDRAVLADFVLAILVGHLRLASSDVKRLCSAFNAAVLPANELALSTLAKRLVDSVH